MVCHVRQAASPCLHGACKEQPFRTEATHVPMSRTCQGPHNVFKGRLYRACRTALPNLGSDTVRPTRKRKKSKGWAMTPNRQIVCSASPIQRVIQSAIQKSMTFALAFLSAVFVLRWVSPHLSNASGAVRGVYRRLYLNSLKLALKHLVEQDGEGSKQADRPMLEKVLASIRKSNSVHVMATLDPEFLPLMARLGASMDLPDTAGRTPLHLASFCGTFEAVVVCLENGANINARDEDGVTPLMLATAAGDTRKARELLKRGADTEAIANTGATALSIACLSGNIELLEVLLESGANLELQVNSNSLLLHTIMNGASEKLKCLLRHGADPNRSEPIAVKRLPEEAAFSNHDEIGCGCPLPEHAQMTPLHFAVRRENLEAVRSLIEAGAVLDCWDEGGNTPLALAVACGDFNIVKELLEGDADPDYATASGESPCSLAIHTHQDDILELLLVAGADPNRVPFGLGRSLLLEAVVRLDPELVELLLKHGADPNFAGAGGRLEPVPLFAAMQALDFSNELFSMPVMECLSSNPEMAQLLVDNTLADSADASLDDKREELLEATKEIVELLLDSGADLYHRDEFSSMVLHQAAVIEHDPEGELLKLLLDRRVPGLNAMAVDLKTPLHLAAMLGNLKACELLVGAGADVFQEDMYGLCPLYGALFGGHQEVALYLRRTLDSK